MNDDDDSLEVKRRAKLNSLYEEVSFAIWDLPGFLDNRDEYYELDDQRANRIDELLHHLVERCLKDPVIMEKVKNRYPIPQAPVNPHNY